MATRDQKRAHKQQRQKVGLRGSQDPASQDATTEGEAHGLSADAATMVTAAPHAPAASAPTCDLEPDPTKTKGKIAPDASPDLEWLSAQLASHGAEKPRAHLDQHGVWHCGDGPRKLGSLTAAEVSAHDEDAVLRLFGMMLAVAIKIIKGPFDCLWAAALCTRSVKQRLLLQLMRDEADKDISPMTWANRRSIILAEEWRASEAKRAGKSKDPTGSQRAQKNADTVLGSAVLNFAATRTLSDYSRWRTRQSAENGPPWATSLTFDVTRSDVELERDGDGVTALLRILGQVNGHRQKQPVFIVSPKGGSAWATVRSIIEGEYEQRGAKVVRTTEGDWMLKVSYRRAAPATRSGAGSLVVLRSPSRFIVALGSDGQVPRKKLDGAGVLAVKKQIASRQHEASEHLPHQGKGARGHGRARFYRILNRLEDKAARYVSTWCQQQAAFIVKQAAELGYGELLVETFEGGIPQAQDRRFERLLRKFPFGKLRTAILQAGLKSGLRVRQVVRQDYVAVPNGDAKKKRIYACPKCGEGMYQDDWLWRCASCGTAGEGDTITAWKLCVAADVECAALEVRAGKEKARWAAIKHPSPVAQQNATAEGGA